jgi:transcription initiation factor IIE alpha subunit
MPQLVYVPWHYSAMNHSAHIAIDEYVLDVLLPDLVRHDHSAPAFLVYIVLWTALFRAGERRIAMSLRQLAEASGLSKSAVQKAIRLLERRRLIQIRRSSPTSTPTYELIRHWIRRRAHRA